MSNRELPPPPLMAPIPSKVRPLCLPSTTIVVFCAAAGNKSAKAAQAANRDVRGALNRVLFDIWLSPGNASSDKDRDSFEVRFEDILETCQVIYSNSPLSLF
jgi:hypothetical protein